MFVHERSLRRLRAAVRGFQGQKDRLTTRPAASYQIASNVPAGFWRRMRAATSSCPMAVIVAGEGSAVVPDGRRPRWPPPQPLSAAPSGAAGLQLGILVPRRPASIAVRSACPTAVKADYK